MKQKETRFHPAFIIVLCSLYFGDIHDSLADVEVHQNSESGLLSWVSTEAGFSVELIQLLPDFVRAVYAKHDFTPGEIERIANYCVFGTIIKNTSGKTLSYDVSSWQYTNNNISRYVKTKTQWLKEWSAEGISFSWTLLPDKGLFDAGDWQQGFTTIDLPRNERFNLTYRWQIEEKSYSATIENMACAPNSLPIKE